MIWHLTTLAAVESTAAAPLWTDVVDVAVQVVIAILTLATLVWAVRIGRDESRRASSERNERLEFEERAQASKVSAWERQWVEQPDGAPAPLFVPGEPYDGELVEYRKIYVHNGSDAPIYDVVVRYFDATMMSDPRAENASTPEEYHRITEGMWRHSVIPAAEERRELEVLRAINCASYTEDLVLEVEFRDGAGRTWVRHTDGSLGRRKDLDGLSAEARWDRMEAEASKDPSFQR
ncbi:hypothetical protein [Cellulosimicrobium funkei]|uniref:hypothetical protein n=1 Tax=Cellulosimicrobium funkei TaxID=264251 RepID=UPI003D7387CC